MESVDDNLARDILGRMKHKDRAKIFSATEYNASQMASVLRSLDLLVTSRYHAGALSLEGHIPQVAVAHDVRLADLYEETGMKGEFFLECSDQDLWPRVRERADRLLKEPTEVRGRLAKAHAEHVARAKLTKGMAAELLRSKGWSVRS
jgi:polysaccharide pyruvyl transferase WcaK-like protein